MQLLRSAERFHSSQPGIESWHCFSAGAHYDPTNLSFGPVVGCDEHLLAPGAGFAEHGHASVTIHSLVLSGTLSHSDLRGESRLLEPGEVMTQRSEGGFRHTERNFSDEAELRLIQLTVIQGVRHECSVVVGSCDRTAAWEFLFVVSGAWTVAGVDVFPGDSIRRESPVRVEGSGVLLSVCAAVDGAAEFS